MPQPLPQHCALFLDIDGTLLNFAPRPELVTVPLGLAEILANLRAQRGGALAIITGRPLADVDKFFPGGLPAAAEHGAIIRDEMGKLHHITSRPREFEHWLATIEAQTRDMPGVVAEVKTVGIVMHFRQAPEYAAQVQKLAETLIAQSGPDVMLLKAHMAYELRPKGASKDASLAWFMNRAPWQNRLPVFIGDDITDEPAIALANQRGGLGLHVARDFDGSPQAVRAWLGEGADK